MTTTSMINNLPKHDLSGLSWRQRVQPPCGHGANLRVNLSLIETETNTVVLAPEMIYIRKRYLEPPFPIQDPPKKCKRRLQTPQSTDPNTYPSLLGIATNVKEKPLSIASEHNVLKRASLVAFQDLHCWGSNRGGANRLCSEGLIETPDLRTWDEVLGHLQQRRPGLVSSAVVLSRSAAFVPLLFPGPAFAWGVSKDGVSTRNNG